MQFNNKLLPVAISLCLFPTHQSLGAIAANDSEARMEKAIQKLSEQTQQLQEEVNRLKTQLRQEKQQKISTHKPSPKQSRRRAKSKTIPPTTENTAQNNNTVILTPKERVEQQQEEAVNYLMGSTVLSSPVLNIHSAYDASDLIVNQSTMNEDLRFLIQRQTLEEILGPAAILPSSRRPRVFLSGKVETQFFYFQPFSSPESTGIDLTGLELDVLAEAGPWAYAFMSINFDNSSLKNPLTLGSGNPINNSRLFLNRGFLTIGNLDASPVYFSMGQEYAPFGDWTTYMLSNPVTKIEGRINSRIAVLGYYNDGVYLSTYALNGAVNTETGFDANNVYEWGVNAGYKYASPNGKFQSNIGAGFVNNIAEAQGYQLTGQPSSSSFQGFAQRADTEDLEHPVGGLDLHASAGWGPYTIYTEFVTATEQFAEIDLSFNDSGAQPSAFHIEGNYTFKIFDKPSAFTLAYEQTWQSLALNLPEHSYIGVFNISIWKNTIESLEFRHDENYSSSDSAAGLCDPTGNGEPISCPVPSVGGSQNQVLLQIGVYF